MWHTNKLTSVCICATLTNMESISQTTRKEIDMIKHTQGEWGIATIDGGAADDEVVTGVNGCLVNIASVFGQGSYSEARPKGEEEPHYEVSKEEAAANARLLAAAPKMFEALEKIARGYDEGEGLSGTGCAEIAAAIIAEIVGE